MFPEFITALLYPRLQSVKVLTKIIIERIKGQLGSLIDKLQTDFCSGSSCTDQINSPESWYYKVQSFFSLLHMLFINFEEAFDNVSRKCIYIESSRSRGILSKLITMMHLITILPSLIWIWLESKLN